MRAVLACREGEVGGCAAGRERGGLFGFVVVVGVGVGGEGRGVGLGLGLGLGRSGRGKVWRGVRGGCVFLMGGGLVGSLRLVRAAGLVFVGVVGVVVLVAACGVVVVVLAGFVGPGVLAVGWGMGGHGWLVGVVVVGGVEEKPIRIQRVRGRKEGDGPSWCLCRYAWWFAWFVRLVMEAEAEQGRGLPRNPARALDGCHPARWRCCGLATYQPFEFKLAYVCSGLDLALAHLCKAFSCSIIT